MSTTHQQDHARKRDDKHSDDLDHTAPGRASASAGLQGPEAPELSGIVMRRAERDGNNVAADAEVHLDRAAAGAGAPLPGDVRGQFESSLGADLSAVRVHTGADSEVAAHAVGAKAYTVGQDIHFGKDHYDPSSGDGLHLLAHEVAHTVQQQGGTPARQNKLEVSSASDHAEVEADRAADAMVAGQQAFVTTNATLSRKVLRDEEDGNPEDMPELKSLQKHIEGDDRPKEVDKDSQYGYGDVNDKDGNAKTSDPVVKNAKEQGALSELQRLSEEMTIAKPLFMSWIESAAAASKIAEAAHLNIATPQAYKGDVDKLGAEMKSGSDKGKQLAAFAASQNKISSASVKSAGLGITEAIAKVAGARNKLASHQAKLEQKAKSKELQDKQDELAKVQAEIKLVANLLKETAGLCVSLSKASSAFNAMSTVASAYNKGANEITGTSDTTEAILQWTFYQPKIDAINGQIDGLNKQIAGLSVQIDTFDTGAFKADLGAAETSFKKASLDMQNEKQAYMAKMQQLGRDFDQKDFKPGEKAVFDGAIPGADTNKSMEGILALSAALQGRGASREAFASIVAASPNLQNAPAIVEKALGGGAGVNVSDGFGGSQFVWLPVDHSYMNPSKELAEQANKLRTTCGSFTAAIKHLKEDAAKEAQVEAAWQSMIQGATGGGGSLVR